MDEQFEDFGVYFRAKIMPGMIRDIEPAMDHLRRTNPEEWLKIAMKLQKRGPYDRIEQQNEGRDALTALVEMIAEGLIKSIPEFVKLYNEAMERHYIQHGLELDELMRKHPNAEPMSAKEAVDAQCEPWESTFDPTISDDGRIFLSITQRRLSSPRCV